MFALAPRDADVLVAMDADVLPVGPLEEILEVVAADDVVAGTLAHYAFPGTTSPADDWASVANGLVSALSFDYEYSLAQYPQPRDNRIPFYLNFGVVLFSRASFERLVPAYLALRPAVAPRMQDDDFSGQVALALRDRDDARQNVAASVAVQFPERFDRGDSSTPKSSMPCRAIHYLRTDRFDRHVDLRLAPTSTDALPGASA